MDSKEKCVFRREGKNSVLFCVTVTRQRVALFLQKRLTFREKYGMIHGVGQHDGCCGADILRAPNEKTSIKT